MPEYDWIILIRKDLFGYIINLLLLSLDEIKL